jgi:hypothetical protein
MAASKSGHVGGGGRQASAPSPAGLSGAQGPVGSGASAQPLRRGGTAVGLSSGDRSSVRPRLTAEIGTYRPEKSN